jgi:hypothetical protein
MAANVADPRLAAESWFWGKCDSACHPSIQPKFVIEKTAPYYGAGHSTTV